jgi:hypothetical protein
MMAADLLECARLLGKIRGAYPTAKTSHELDAAAENIKEFARGYAVNVSGWADEIALALDGSDKPAATPPKAVKPAARKAKAAAKKEKAPAAKGPDAASAKGEAGTAAGGGTSMGVCVICGTSYLRRGPAQKTCSAECLEKKRAGLDKFSEPVKPAAAPAAQA